MHQWMLQLDSLLGRRWKVPLKCILKVLKLENSFDLLGMWARSSRSLISLSFALRQRCSEGEKDEDSSLRSKGVCVDAAWMCEVLEHLLSVFPPAACRLCNKSALRVNSRLKQRDIRHTHIQAASERQKKRMERTQWHPFSSFVRQSMNSNEKFLLTED